MSTIHKPGKVTRTEAAGTIRDGVGAYAALHCLSHLSSGKPVLIMDGTRALATTAVQSAHRRGASDCSSSSTDDRQSLESLRLSIAE